MMWKFKEFENAIAAIDESGSMTYRELESEGNALAEVVGERCLVFNLCRNSFGSLAGYTGFINNNIVPLLLDENINIELLNMLIETYKPAFIWVASECTDKFEFPVIYESLGFALLKTVCEPFALYDELALLLTTSGSTGSPKLVRQSYKNIISNAEAIVEYLELTADERPITTLPMNYTYGLSIINSHLLVGASILMTEKSLMQKEFWSFFEENNATSFGGVPYTYEILKKLRFFKKELPSLRYMTQAGGKLSPELHKEFAEYSIETGKRFYVMYGQTEATARMSYLPYKKSLDKYGSMGIAVPGGEFRLIDVNGNEITESETVGELVYKGENVTLGYAECVDDLSKGDERNGVLITGDMAKRDKDGYYFVVGRKKRFLKIFGNRVNLDETERMIKTKFEIDCACAGIDDKMTIYLTDADYEKEVKLFVAEKTGLNPVAFEIRAIDEIPKNEAGKTLYSKLEASEN